MSWMQKVLKRDYAMSADHARYTEALLTMRYGTLDWVGDSEIKIEYAVVIECDARNDTKWLSELAESYAL